MSNLSALNDRAEAAIRQIWLKLILIKSFVTYRNVCDIVW